MSTVISKNLQVGADGTASNNFTIYQPASPDGTLRIGNGNTGTTSAQVVLTSAGNVGIGTSSPTDNIEISKSGGSGITFTRTGAPASVVRISNASDLLNLSSTNVGIRFLTGATPAERMRITSAGDVGIGTSSPGASLHVVGNARVTGTLSNAGTRGWTQTIGDPATDLVYTLARQTVWQLTVACQSGALDVAPRMAQYLVRGNAGTTSGLAANPIGGETGAFSVFAEANGASTSTFNVRVRILDSTRVFGAASEIALI